MRTLLIMDFLALRRAVRTVPVGTQNKTRIFADLPGWSSAATPVPLIHDMPPLRVIDCGVPVRCHLTPCEQGARVACSLGSEPMKHGVLCIKVQWFVLGRSARKLNHPRTADGDLRT